MIIFFSGTGNSRYIARRLAELLGDQNVTDVRGEILYNPLDCKLECRDERIVWVFPTYSWGVPPVIVRFIKEAEIAGAENAEHYMVTTCGDDTGLAASQWRRLLKRRKWAARSAYSVIMPNTYVLMKGFDVDSDELAEQKIDDSAQTVADIAQKIKANTAGDSLIKGSWPWIKSKIIYPWFVKFCMSPKPFRANDRCIGCGKCAKVCPMANIIMKEERPTWHDRCALCLACYHVCPTVAVQYGNATRDKGRYRNLICKQD